MIRFLYFLISLLIISCSEDIVTDFNEGQTQYKPVLMNINDLDESIFYSDPQTLVQPGKFYLYPPYVLINERFEGIHIIDNGDPYNPKAVGFIRIPGCADMAVKNNILYADNATDLVSIDITDPERPALVDRDRNVFPDLIPPDNGSIPDKYSSSKRPPNTVIIKWVK